MRKLLMIVAMVALVVAAPVPALAQSATDDQYGEEATAFSARGVITEVSGSSITVEGTSTNDNCGAAILKITEGTEIFFVRGGTVPATVDDLRVGQTVDVPYSVPKGPRTMECPQTYEALEIFILPEGFDPPEGPGTPPGDDQYDPSPPAGDGPVPPSGGSDAPDKGHTSVLPNTGGVSLATLGVGMLLICGGLIARRIFR